MVKLSSKRAINRSNKDNSKMQYCAGFSDANGIWNTGFYCPVPSGAVHVCCGSDTVRYCCPSQRKNKTKNLSTTRQTNDNQHTTPEVRLTVGRHSSSVNPITEYSSSLNTTDSLSITSTLSSGEFPVLKTQPEVFVCDHAFHCYDNNVVIIIAAIMCMILFCVSCLTCLMCKMCPLYKHRKRITHITPPCYESLQFSCGVTSTKSLCSDYYDMKHLEKSHDVMNPWEQRRTVMVNTAVESKIKLEGPLFDDNALAQPIKPSLYSDVFIGDKYNRDSFFLGSKLSDPQLAPQQFRPKTLSSLAQLRPHSFMSDTTGDFPESDVDDCYIQENAQHTSRTSNSSLNSHVTHYVNESEWCGESDTDWSYCNAKFGDVEIVEQKDDGEQKHSSECCSDETDIVEVALPERKDGDEVLGQIQHCEKTGISYISV